MSASSKPALLRCRIATCTFGTGRSFYKMQSCICIIQRFVRSGVLRASLASGKLWDLRRYDGNSAGKEGRQIRLLA
jgi:hypothetical protein